jgi:subtilisin family serine protease
MGVPQSVGEEDLDVQQLVQRALHVCLICLIACTSLVDGSTYDTYPQTSRLILQFTSPQTTLAAADILTAEPYNQTTTIDLLSYDLAFIAVTARSQSLREAKDPYFLLPNISQVIEDDIRWPESADTRSPDLSTNSLHETGEANDPLFHQQWGLRTMRIPETWYLADIKFDTRSPITVAIIDTGVDFTHPDLQGAYHSASYDWVLGTPQVTDKNGHGTHLAGIIAASTDNYIGMSGIAPVRILSETVYEEGVGIYTSRSAMAICHAAQAGAHIILLGYGGKKYSDIEAKAISYARDQGSLIIASAGNDQSNASHYPSDMQNVISVGSISESESISVFSNYGIFLDFVGPGQNVYGTAPENRYVRKSGTSQAAASLSGVAALIWSFDPNLTAQGVQALLVDSAHDLGKAGKDIYYGWGYPDSLGAAQLLMS